MTKDQADFESWFDILATTILDETGVTFRDRDSVRDEYEDGHDVFDVADDIIAEYEE